MPAETNTEQLKAENEALRTRLEEVEATLEAIHAGEVDAVVVGGAGGQRVYTLEGTEQFYRILIEKMQQGAATLSTDGTLLYCNRSFALLLNLAQEKVAGARFDRWVAPADLALWQASLRQAQTKSSSTEIRLQRLDRPPLPVHVALDPMSMLGAMAVGMVLTDLTDQKRQAETDRRLLQEGAARIAAQEAAAQATRSANALRASEERFRTLAMSTPMVVWTNRPDGSLDYISQRWFDLTGQSAEQVYQSADSWLEAMHPEDRPRVSDLCARSLKAGEPFEMEVRLRRGCDGGYQWHLCRGVPLRNEDGTLARFIGTCTDIGEQKRVEQNLRFLADASATLAAIVDWESTLQKVASLAVPFFADWCAVDIAESTGVLRRLAVAHIDPAKVKLAHELESRYPPDPEAPRGALHVFRTGRSEMADDIPDALLVNGARDGEHLRLLRALGLKSYMCVPLRTRGKTTGVITFVSAESGRRYTNNDLAFAEELARRAAVSLENAQLYAELRETDRLKDEFLAMLAHELRNPLAPIRNALHIIKQPGTNNDMVQEVRDMADRQVQHMARLLDDLLDVSRISRGKIELRREVVDLKLVVNRTIDAVRPFIEERGHELTLSLPAAPLRVQGDPTRLEQVVTNLLNNSAKYTEPGGHIWLKVSREDDTAILSVRDNGVGIGPAMLPKIFDLFVQAECRADRSQGGVGIGLTLVRRLVELHGGSIKAHSAGIGQGSEFVVRLPADVEGIGNVVSSSSAGQRPDLPPRRILVVDDNQDAANSLAMLLRLTGQEVQSAYNGPAALAIAHEFRPSLVLLDIGMPSMDGYETARQMRANTDLQRATLVALTGWGQEEDRRRSKEAGFDFHLVKPVDPETLLKLLTSLR